MTNTNEFISRLEAASGAERILPQEQGLFGIEREALRVNTDGTLAQSAHPTRLGAALTHPNFTTDYAEPMLEMVTQPHPSVEAAHDELGELTQYVYQQLGDELLWPHSMPCVLGDEAGIPIANYGPSDQGQFKHLYRVGLAHRYGRTMQVISGVHFNMSIDDRAWSRLYPDLDSDTARNTGYFVALRNLQRIGWVVPYLFGSSPSACRSMARGRATSLVLENETTLVGPSATSLRLGDIGYNNSDKRGYTFKANYSGIEQYIASLLWAVKTPRDDFSAIGLSGPEGRRQISANHLQIENEYYASVRPKQVARQGETPLQALRNRGVAYLELRSLDINPWSSQGVDVDTLRVLECLVWVATLGEADEISDTEHRTIESNWRNIAHFGRDPQTRLNLSGQSCEVSHWVRIIAEQLRAVAKSLSPAHEQSVERCVNSVLDDVEKTRSAQWLSRTADSPSFFNSVMQLANEHKDKSATTPLSTIRNQALAESCEQSLRDAAQSAEKMQGLEQYIADYQATWDL